MRVLVLKLVSVYQNVTKARKINNLGMLRTFTWISLLSFAGTFTLSVAVDKLFFIGSQLVALSKIGKVGIWHSMTHNWQVQGLLQCSVHVFLAKKKKRLIRRAYFFAGFSAGFTSVLLEHIC